MHNTKRFFHALTFCRQTPCIISFLTKPHSESAKQLTVHFIVETDQNGLTDLQCRRTKIASRTQHHLRQRRVIRPIVFKINLSDFFPLGDKHLCHTLQQFNCFIGTKAFLFGVNFRLRCNILSRKKLLRAGTRSSTFAVIAPVNFSSHNISPYARFSLNSRGQ